MPTLNVSIYNDETERALRRATFSITPSPPDPADRADPEDRRTAAEAAPLAAGDGEMSLSIISNSGFRKAIVSEDADGVFINYYRVSTQGAVRFDRCTRPALPLHAALNLATRIINHAPPRLGGRL